jgi:hypothetical protein
MAVTARQLAGFAVVVGTLPYLTLKALWLTGHPVGLTDPAFAEDPSLQLLNLATAGMDVVAIVLAVALTQDWGQRLPEALVLVPMWIGTGFLAPIVLTAPLILGEQANLPLEAWVQPVVYGGFAWQGVALLVAFALYVRARWPRFATARRTSGTSPVITRVGAVLGLFVAAVGLTSGRLIDVLLGILALAAVVGVSAIVERWQAGGLVWPPAVAGWVGTGAMFSWGAWGVLNVVGSTVLVSSTNVLDTAADAAKVLGALLLAYGVTRSPDLRATRYASARALP